MTRRAGHLLPFGLLLAYLASGFFVVVPGEVAVVRRFGKVVLPPRAPGLHFGWPRGVDRISTVRTDAVRRLTVGLSDSDSGGEPGSGEYLTGDLNFLRARATVQYRVADPVAFVTRSGEIEPILQRLAEASLARAVASQGIDASLKEGRPALALAARDFLEAEAVRDGLGISILGVSLTDARPPSEVAPDFAAAQSARSERDRRVNEAKTYSSTIETQATAAAARRLDQTRARADRTIKLARAKAERFLSLLAETRKERPLTIRRLYLDTLRELLPQVRRKIVLGSDEPLDLSILGTP